MERYLANARVLHVTAHDVRSADTRGVLWCNANPGGAAIQFRFDSNPASGLPSTGGVSHQGVAITLLVRPIRAVAETALALAMQEVRRGMGREWW